MVKYIIIHIRTCVEKKKKLLLFIQNKMDNLVAIYNRVHVTGLSRFFYYVIKVYNQSVKSLGLTKLGIYGFFFFFFSRSYIMSIIDLIIQFYFHVTFQHKRVFKV